MPESTSSMPLTNMALILLTGSLVEAQPASVMTRLVGSSSFCPSPLIVYHAPCPDPLYDEEDFG